MCMYSTYNTGAMVKMLYVVCVWCVCVCSIRLTYTGILAFSRTDFLKSETAFSSDELMPTAGMKDGAQVP